MSNHSLAKDTPPLTERELQIAHGLLNGGRISSIAENLGLSKETVRHHLKSIFQKFEVHSQDELIHFLKTGNLDQLPGEFSTLSEMEGFLKATNQRIVEHVLEDINSQASLVEMMTSSLWRVLPTTLSSRFEWIIRLRFWNSTFSSHNEFTIDDTVQGQSINSGLEILSKLVDRGLIADHIDLKIVMDELVDLGRSIGIRALSSSDPNLDELKQLAQRKVTNLINEFQLDPAEKR